MFRVGWHKLFNIFLTITCILCSSSAAWSFVFLHVLVNCGHSIVSQFCNPSHTLYMAFPVSRPVLWLLSVSRFWWPMSRSSQTIEICFLQTFMSLYSSSAGQMQVWIYVQLSSSLCLHWLWRFCDDDPGDACDRRKLALGSFRVLKTEANFIAVIQLKVNP